jgi:hypothetical protein
LQSAGVTLAAPSACFTQGARELDNEIRPDACGFDSRRAAERFDSESHAVQTTTTGLPNTSWQATTIIGDLDAYIGVNADLQLDALGSSVPRGIIHQLEADRQDLLLKGAELFARYLALDAHVQRRLATQFATALSEDELELAKAELGLA